MVLVDALHLEIGPDAGERARSTVDPSGPRRATVDWPARYRLDPEASWRVCRVLDVSRRGGALALRGTSASEDVTGPIELQIASIAGRQIGVALRGVVRDHVHLGGWTIAGVQFDASRSASRDLCIVLAEVARHATSDVCARDVAPA